MKSAYVIIFVLSLLLVGCGPVEYENTQQEIEQPQEVVEQEEENIPLEPPLEEENTQEVVEDTVEQEEKDVDDEEVSEEETGESSEETTEAELVEEEQPKKPEKITFDVGAGAALDRAEKLVLSYHADELSREEFAVQLWEFYEFGELSMPVFTDLIGQAYVRRFIDDSDLREIILKPYVEFDITVLEFMEVMYTPYDNKQFNKITLKKLTIDPYNENILKRTMAREVLVQGYEQSHLDDDTFGFLIMKSYADGDLDYDALHWFTSQGVDADRITPETVHMLVVEQGLRKGRVSVNETRDFLRDAYKNGYMSRGEVEWIVIAGHAERDFTEEDFTFKQIIA